MVVNGQVVKNWTVVNPFKPDIRYLWTRHIVQLEKETATKGLMRGQLNLSVNLEVVEEERVLQFIRQYESPNEALRKQLQEFFEQAIYIGWSPPEGAVDTLRDCGISWKLAEQ